MDLLLLLDFANRACSDLDVQHNDIDTMTEQYKTTTRSRDSQTQSVHRHST